MDVSKLKVGDRVYGTADNYGFEGEIVEERDPLGSPQSRFKVRQDSNGEEFWAYDFEIDGLEEEDANAT